MKNEVMAFCERLGVTFYEALIPYYEAALKDRAAMVPRMFDKDRIKKINDQYNIFRKVFDDVMNAIDLIREDEDLVVMNCVLAKINMEGKRAANIMPVPAGTTVATDFSPAPAVLYFLEDAIETLEKRGLPLDIISDSLSGIESEILAYHDMHGRYGMRDYADWYFLFVRCEIIRVGRLQYQHFKFSNSYRIFERDGDIAVMMNNIYMHKNGSVFGSLGQKDEEGKYFAYLKEEDGKIIGFRADRYGEVAPTPVVLEGYREVIKEGDNLFSIHITNGEPFDIGLIRDSFARCDEVIKNHYADLDIKGYIGFSWVFNKHLRDIMGRDTNITMLADMFTIYPITGGHHGIYEYVFSLPESTPYEELPERTSMQRGIKKYLLEGNYFLEKAGIKFT